MTNLAKRPPLGLKQDKPLRSKKMLDKIRELPCAVCQAHGEQQLSPTTAHHPIHDRYGVYKRGDDWCVPLCDGHHQALFDDSKQAIHKDKRAWREKYGPDWSYAPYSPTDVQDTDM